MNEPEQNTKYSQEFSTYSSSPRLNILYQRKIANSRTLTTLSVPNQNPGCCEVK